MNEATLRVALEALDAIRSANPGTNTTLHRIIQPILTTCDLDERCLSSWELQDIIVDCLDEAGNFWLDGTRHIEHSKHPDYYLSSFTIRKLDTAEFDKSALFQGLETFYFSLGGYFSDSYTIAICKDSDGWRSTIEISSISSPGAAVKRTRRVSTRMIATLAEYLSAINVLDWETTYWCPALDGLQWSISLGLSGGLGLKSNGSNSYPSGFDALMQVLDCLGLEGVGEYHYASLA